MRLTPAPVFQAALSRVEATDFSSYIFQYPPMAVWPRAQSEKPLFEAWARVAAAGRSPGLYVHVPFCRTKCTFCRFFVLESSEARTHSRFVSALGREAALWAPVFKKVEFSTLYFGGGTPSLLGVRPLERMFAALYERFTLKKNAQITFEANPEFLTPAKLAVLTRAGVTRLTLGVQSLDDAVTSRVERSQTNAAVPGVFRAARKAGIPYINIDVMAGLPGQSLESFRATFEEVLSWRPDTIHINPFEPTPLTRFSQRGERHGEQARRLSAAMQLYGRVRMQDEGYGALPYDAMALRPEARNRQLEDSVIGGNSFLGLGCGAVSCAGGRLRYVNTGNLESYCRAAEEGRLPTFKSCALGPRQERINFVLNHLWYGRLDDGEFKRSFGRSVRETFAPAIHHLEALGVLKREAGAAAWRVENRGPAADFEVRRAFFEPGVVRALAAAR